MIYFIINLLTYDYDETVVDYAYEKRASTLRWEGPRNG